MIGDVFEEKRRKAGGVMGASYWVGDRYLKSNHQRILKVMQVHGAFRLLEPKKLDAGFAFVGDAAIEDIGPYKLDEVFRKAHVAQEGTFLDRAWAIGRHAGVR